MYSYPALEGSAVAAKMLTPFDVSYDDINPAVPVA